MHVSFNFSSQERSINRLKRVVGVAVQLIYPKFYKTLRQSRLRDRFFMIATCKCRLRIFKSPLGRYLQGPSTIRFGNCCHRFVQLRARVTAWRRLVT